MGDVLQVTPLLQGLKQNHPDGEIHLLVSSPNRCLVENNPWVDRIITCPVEQLTDEAKNRSDPTQAKEEINRLIDTLREEEYDLVINRQFTRFEMCLVPCLNARDVLGPYYSPLGDPNAWKKDLWVSLKDELPTGKANFNADPKTALHIWNTLNNRKGYRTNLVDVGLDLAGVTGPERIMIIPGQQDRARAEVIFQAAELEGHGPVLGVQVGASKDFRFLDPHMVAEVLTLWQVRHGGSIVFFGTEKERECAESIIGRIRRPETAFNLAGRTSLLELAACLERVDLLLTPDTGTLHMAAAVDTPTVSLFYGSASPWETGPYGKGHMLIYADLPCAPCKNVDNCTLDGFCKSLFSSSAVAEVLDLAYDVLKSGPEGDKKAITQEWAKVWANDYSSCGFRVLYTGWQETTSPLMLYELTSESMTPMPRLSPPRMLKATAQAKACSPVPART